MSPRADTADVHGQRVFMRRRREGERVVLVPAKRLARQPDPLARLVLEVAGPLEGKMRDVWKRRVNRELVVSALNEYLLIDWH